jgi:hypothetical protein
MIVKNKTIVSYNGRVYGPGDYVPDAPEVKEEIKEQEALEIEQKIERDEKPTKIKSELKRGD